VTELRRNLARAMKRRRAVLAISQAQLAERAGLSAGYVGELETGLKDPSLETLGRIADALEVKPYQLMMSDEDVADAAGQGALYEAVDFIKQRLDEQLDDLRRGGSDGNPGGKTGK
jgi:transcriptional regulator with XRE-family HTH domain